MANIKSKSKITNYIPIEKKIMTPEELSEGMLVWFIPDEFCSRVGLIVKITSRGTQKFDILWQKSGENYTVKRVKIEDIKEKVFYKTIEDHNLAVHNFCNRVLKDGSNPTGAASDAATIFL